MPFQPGQSGNPNGRPPKSRALTDLLAQRAAVQVTRDGKKLTGGELLALLLWEVATTGQAKFPDGSELIVGVRDWLETVKWLYAHIDGPAPKPEPIDPDDELSDADLEAMSDEDLEALIRRQQKRKGKARG